MINLHRKTCLCKAKLLHHNYRLWCSECSYTEPNFNVGKFFYELMFYGDNSGAMEDILFKGTIVVRNRVENNESESIIIVNGDKLFFSKPIIFTEDCINGILALL